MWRSMLYSSEYVHAAISNSAQQSYLNSIPRVLSPDATLVELFLLISQFYYALHGQPPNFSF